MVSGGSWKKTAGRMPTTVSFTVRVTKESGKRAGAVTTCMSGDSGGSESTNGRAGIFNAPEYLPGRFNQACAPTARPEEEGHTMQAYYEKFVDRVIPQKMEKRLRLGRRSEEDRRLMDDRRTYVDEGYLDSKSERRDSESNRRSLIERRQRWFRTSQYRSRHV
jgi:hypothetical protein